MASIAHANFASSSSVERLFSAAGRVVGRNRANTKPERVETILLVNNNKNTELWMEDSWGQTKKCISYKLPYLQKLSKGKVSQVGLLKQKQKQADQWTPRNQFRN